MERELGHDRDPVAEGPELAVAEPGRRDAGQRVHELCSCGRLAGRARARLRRPPDRVEDEPEGGFRIGPDRSKYVTVGPLAFAGEHTAGEHGLMEGALRSGVRGAAD